MKPTNIKRWLTVRNVLLVIILLLLLLVLTDCANSPNPNSHPRAIVDYAKPQ